MRLSFVRSLALSGALSAPLFVHHGAMAQDTFAVESFEPAVDPSKSLLNVYGANVRAPGAYSVSLVASYGRRPLSVEDADGGKDLGDLVGSVGTLQLMGAIGLFPRVDLGFALPLHRLGAGSDYAVAPPPAVQGATLAGTEIALGDLRLVPRVGLVQRSGDRGFDLALLAPLSLPTGKDAVYAGEAFRAEPRLAASYTREGLLVAANVGYLIRERARLLDVAINDMLRWGLGAEVPFGAGLSGLVEVSGQVNVLESSTDAPTEGLLGLRYRNSGLLVQLGGGPGIVRDLSAPTYRLFAGITYAGGEHSKAPPVEPDHDGDGLIAPQDQCPHEPEDKDGFQDDDGCPDPDNDQDGIPDASDRCPDEPEDADGFEDDDGCPEPDNDRDGISDAVDTCPNEPEDVDGFEDENGCPDPDDDGDGVLDGEDQCPREAGVPEAQGCPRPVEEKVAVTQDRLELRETVLFVTGSSVIDTASYPLLDAIADALKAHPEVTLVSVRGHTDSRGSAAVNRKLSQARAESVMKALIERGVEPARLKAQGFGSSQPLVPNDTPENLAKNRRVELHIEARAAAEPPSAP